MIEVPNEQQLFYSRDGSSWQTSVNGEQWSDEKCQGYLYKHKTWDERQAIEKPPLSPEEVILQCKSDLAEKRWEVMTAGVTIDGTPIQSNDKSKDEMAGYVTESIVNGLVNVNWKLEDGSFKVYTVQQFKKVYQIVAKYRNDCFGVEHTKQGEIDLADDPTSVPLDTGWPTNIFTTV